MKVRVKSPKILGILVVLLFIISTFLLVKNRQLQKYVYLINDKYKIPTEQSIKDAIPDGSKFVRQDAFGIIHVDIPSLLKDHYLVDPNHVNKFYWIDSTGKEIDLTNKSESVNIGIPLKPEDIDTKNPENVGYVTEIYQKLISVFENSGFKLKKSYSKMELFGFDNQVFVDISAFENSSGTKCIVRKPERYSFSEISKTTSTYSDIGYRTLIYIYIACVD